MMIMFITLCSSGCDPENDIEMKTNVEIETKMDGDMGGVPILMMGSDRSDGDGHMVGANHGHNKLPRVLHGTFYFFLFFFSH